LHGHGKEVGLEVNAEKSKYTLLAHPQNAGKKHHTEIANTAFENVAQFKYLGMTVKNQNLIQEEIKKRLNSGNSCYQSVQNITIRIYKIIILPVVLYRCETWSLTLREEHILRVFENTVLRRIFGPKRDEVTRGWKKIHAKALHNLCSSPSKIRMIKSRRMRWAGHIT
jgi:hypothetical protein